MARDKTEYLGALIKKAIEESGIKQTVIADRMGVKRQTINQIDTRKTFDLEFLQKLKEASGLDFTNYIFNPSKHYKTAETVVTTVEEKTPIYPDKDDETTSMLFTLTVNGTMDAYNRFPELLRRTKQLAVELGFKIM